MRGVTVVDLALVDEALQHGREHLAADDAGLDQLEEAVDEHLRAAVQAVVEAAELARPSMPSGHDFEDAAVLVAVPVAHDQRLAIASPSEPMPICSVPPSATRAEACRPMA